MTLKRTRAAGTLVHEPMIHHHESRIWQGRYGEDFIFDFCMHGKREREREKSRWVSFVWLSDAIHGSWMMEHA